MLKTFLGNIPDFFIVEITNRCNIRCPACPWHTCMRRKIHDMTWEEYCVILEKISPYAKAVCFYVMGEPFLNPDWYRIVKLTHEQGIKTIISSNGMLLEENMEKIFASGLDHLQVAVDGNDSQTHEQYRVGSNYLKIMAALEKLSKMKDSRQCKNPEVVIQTLVTRQNENQIDEIKSIMNQLGFGFKTKKMHYGRTEIVSNKNRPLFMPSNERFVRMEGKSYYSKGIPCVEMQHMVILSNGDVVPCCIDFDASNKIGNIFSDSVMDIWTGQRRNSFIENYNYRCNSFCEKCDLD